MLNVEQKRRLIEVARQALTAAVAHGPAPDLATDDPNLRQPRGAFVTLKKAGQLRGCIGYIEPHVPLIEAVAESFSSRPAARPDCLRKPGASTALNCCASRQKCSQKNSRVTRNRLRNYWARGPVHILHLTVPPACYNSVHKFSALQHNDWSGLPVWRYTGGTAHRHQEEVNRSDLDQDRNRLDSSIFSSDYSRSCVGRTEATHCPGDGNYYR